MSRYSFANCAVSPNRDKVTALSQGASNSWIQGTSIHHRHGERVRCVGQQGQALRLLLPVLQTGA